MGAVPPTGGWWSHVSKPCIPRSRLRVWRTRRALIWQAPLGGCWRTSGAQDQHRGGDGDHQQPRLGARRRRGEPTEDHGGDGPDTCTDAHRQGGCVPVLREQGVRQGRWTPLPRSSCRAAVARSSALPGRVGVRAAVIAPIARDVLGARGRAWRRGRRGRPRRGGEHRGARASHLAEPQRQEWCRLDATAMELTAPCS